MGAPLHTGNTPNSPLTSQPAPQPASAPAPQPYVSDPGIQAGQFQPNLSWVNQSGPGKVNQYWDQTKDALSSPSYGEVNNQGLNSWYSDPNNRPAVTNNAQSWFDQFRGNMPSIGTEPGFGAYYDHAKDRAAESINKSVASRGVYGSSAANDQISRAYSDLEADRAKNEADYNLRRLSEQRAWQGMGGQFANSADSASQAQSQAEQAWAGLLSKLGIDASRLGLDRVALGGNLAGNASAEARNAGQDAFSNQMAMGNALSDLIYKVLGPALDNDATLKDKVSSGQVGAANQAANAEATNANNTVNAIGTGAQLYSQLYGNGKP